MNTKTVPMSAELRGATALRAGGGLGAAVRGRLAAVRRLRARRKAIAQLSRMSDEALLDIGVARDRIPDVVDGLLAREAPAAGGRSR